MMLYAYFNGLIEGCQKHFNNLQMKEEEEEEETKDRLKSNIQIFNQ